MQRFSPQTVLNAVILALVLAWGGYVKAGVDEAKEATTEVKLIKKDIEQIKDALKKLEKASEKTSTETKELFEKILEAVKK